MSAPVAVAIVTHESARDLPACLAAVERLAPPPAELVIVDCASRDDSVACAREARPPGIETRILALEKNVGFAQGTNVALAHSASEWILTLNADAVPQPDYLGQLLQHAARPRAAALTGRLVRPGAPGRLDACGMRLTRSWRHLDRGSGELDRGQYGRAELVFGATGAATLWRRAALADVAIDGDCFDVRFHSFREDAELCMRLQERAWDVVYEPSARATHRRRVLPSKRSQLPAPVNRQSLRNRYLLRVGHQTVSNLLRTLPWTLARDLGALAWVVTRERSSLPAYSWLWRHRAALRARRRQLLGRRTEPRALERWFRCDGAPL